MIKYSLCFGADACLRAALLLTLGRLYVCVCVPKRGRKRKRVKEEPLP